jgi:hypothetical protein
MARAIKLLFLVLALGVALVGGPAKADKRIALIVGNSGYQNIPQLANPRNDASLMAETLRGVGFTLVGGRALIDLDKVSFDSAIQNFGNQLAGADVALFYYAGHGIQVRGSNYMVPISANPAKEADVDFQLVDVALVLRQMEGSGTRLNLVILDACRNNPLAGRSFRSSSGGLAQMQAPEGTLISYATQPGNVALDGDGGNSPYTKALAQTVQRAGLDIFKTFNEVGLAVKRSTGGQQQPWLSSSPIDGNFYFVEAPASSNLLSSGGNTADDASQAWDATKDTTSPAVLEAFIQRYSTSFYSNLARARLDELNASTAKQSSQVAAISPSAIAPKPTNQSQRAVLYEEDLSAKGQQYSGSVTWRIEQIKTSGGPDDIAVHADIDIADRNFKMSLSLRRNVDQSLPASHTLELKFRVPPDFAGGGIASVPGILVKSNEQARGTPLGGLVVKVSDGFFLTGLSMVDRERNVRLLLEQKWFDIPIVYSNQRRAILAVEKGSAGEQAFKTAFSFWEQSSPNVVTDAKHASYIVQVISQRNEEDAAAAYKVLQSKFPDVLGARAPIMTRADTGKGVYYRASIGPFQTPDEAAQFCGSLKAAGGQCVVQRN